MSDYEIKSKCCDAATKCYMNGGSRHYDFEMNSTFVCDSCKKPCTINVVGEIPDDIRDAVLSVIGEHNRRFN